MDGFMELWNRTDTETKDKIVNRIGELAVRLVSGADTRTEPALPIHNVSDTLIAWEQFKKANWWESDAVDVEKVLMDKFQVIYGR